LIVVIKYGLQPQFRLEF